MKIKSASVLCVAVLAITSFSGMTMSAAPNSSEEQSQPSLPNLRDWHYRVPLTVNSSHYNRTNYILTQEINVTKEIGGFGSFDNNSVRVVETNETGALLWEVPSQTRRGWVEGKPIIYEAQEYAVGDEFGLWDNRFDGHWGLRKNIESFKNNNTLVAYPYTENVPELTTKLNLPEGLYQIYIGMEITGFPQIAYLETKIKNQTKYKKIDLKGKGFGLGS